MYIENLSSNTISSLEGYVSSKTEKIDVINGSFGIQNLLSSTPTLFGPIQIEIHEDLISSDNSDLIYTISAGYKCD